MNSDGILDKHDLSTDSIREELLLRTFSDEGLWFVSRYVIGNTRLSERIHKPMLKWVQREIQKPDALLALRDPRASGKTDGCTIALPPWSWATMPVAGTVLQGVNTCLAFVAPKKDLASYIFISNVERRLQATQYFNLYEHVRPDPHFWSLKNGLLLRRTLVHGLPSLLPLGMESVSTSLHPPILIVDDPVHEQNYRSPTELRRINDWVAHSHSLTTPTHGARLFIGNHWAIGDVQDNFHPERPECRPEFKRVKVWERGITGCEACVSNRAPLDRFEEGALIPHEHVGDIFPVALDAAEGVPEPVEYIDAVAASKPTYIFLTQHENRLVDARTLHFRKEHLRFYDWHYLPDGQMALQVPLDVMTGLAKREAGGTVEMSPRMGGTFEILPLDALDIYILVDPAPSEEAADNRSEFAAALIGCERTGPRRFLLAEYARNAPEHEHINLLLDWYVQWRGWFRRYGIESIGYQATLKDSLLTAAAGRGIHTLRESEIEMLSRLRSEGQQIDRIKYALTPQLELHHFFVRREHRIFRVQHDTFGVRGAKHDLLDAISNLDRVIVGRGRAGHGAEMAAAQAARARRRRVGNTGY